MTVERRKQQTPEATFALFVELVILHIDHNVPVSILLQQAYKYYLSLNDEVIFKIFKRAEANYFRGDSFDSYTLSLQLESKEHANNIKLGVKNVLRDIEFSSREHVIWYALAYYRYLDSQTKKSA